MQILLLAWVLIAAGIAYGLYFGSATRLECARQDRTSVNCRTDVVVLDSLVIGWQKDLPQTTETWIVSNCGISWCHYDVYLRWAAGDYRISRHYFNQNTAETTVQQVRAFIGAPRESALSLRLRNPLPATLGLVGLALPSLATGMTLMVLLFRRRIP